MKNSIRILGMAAAVSLIAGASNAAIVGVIQQQGDATGAGGSGSAEIIAAPVKVFDDNVTNSHMQGFDEQQNFTLSSAVSIDGGGTIAAGTAVDSHMIFLNSVGTKKAQHGGVVWTFSGVILGIMSDSGGNLEAASSSQLGASGTSYPGAFNNRGLESNNGTGQGSNDGYFLLAPNQLRVSMNVTEPGDWIRVVTAAVPVPASLPLLAGAFGLFGLFGRRRRKNA